MRVLLAWCLLGVVLLAGCGGGASPIGRQDDAAVQQAQMLLASQPRLAVPTQVIARLASWAETLHADGYTTHGDGLRGGYFAMAGWQLYWDGFVGATPTPSSTSPLVFTHMVDTLTASLRLMPKGEGCLTGVLQLDGVNPVNGEACQAMPVLTADLQRAVDGTVEVTINFQGAHAQQAVLQVTAQAQTLTVQPTGSTYRIQATGPRQAAWETARYTLCSVTESTPWLVCEHDPAALPSGMVEAVRVYDAVHGDPTSEGMVVEILTNTSGTRTLRRYHPITGWSIYGWETAQ